MSYKPNWLTVLVILTTLIFAAVIILGLCIGTISDAIVKDRQDKVAEKLLTLEDCERQSEILKKRRKQLEFERRIEQDAKWIRISNLRKIWDKHPQCAGFSEKDWNKLIKEKSDGSGYSISVGYTVCPNCVKVEKTKDERCENVGYITID